MSRLIIPRGPDSGPDNGAADQVVMHINIDIAEVNENEAIALAAGGQVPEDFAAVSLPTAAMQLEGVGQNGEVVIALRVVIPPGLMVLQRTKSRLVDPKGQLLGMQQQIDRALRGNAPGVGQAPMVRLLVAKESLDHEKHMRVGATANADEEDRP